MDHMDRNLADVSLGRKENTHLFHKNDGYHYHLRELRGTRIRLRCRKYNSGCPGTAVIFNESGRLWHRRAHNHEPDNLLIEDGIMRREMIRDASSINYGRSARSILMDWKLRCADPNLASRFTRARMLPSLYMALSSQYPRIPNTLQHLGVLLGIPNMREISRTVDGRDMIFRGVVGFGIRKTTAVIFISGRMLNFLQSRKSLHIDGTFKKRCKKPKCAQILNITTRYHYTVIGIARVLMERRTCEAYLEVFDYIKLLAPGLNPERIHCDFERALITSLRMSFPLPCQIVGCLWHYAVACSSYARKLGLREIVLESEIVYSFLRCLCAVPFLPPNLMEVGLIQLWNEVTASGWADELRPMFEYFEDYWLPMREELSVWGCPERTNNCAESDNHMLKTVLPQNRPNIWQLIGGFVKLEYLAWCDKLAIEQGRTVRGTRRWKAVANDAAVRRASESLQDGEITPAHFLHRVSYTILAPVNHGLRLQRDASDSESDEESDANSDSDEDTDTETDED